MSEPQLLYICGSGHSGSTLLDMLLAGHSQISSLGEVGNLSLYLKREGEADVCTCGEQVTHCPFWTAVESAARELRPDTPPPVLPSLTLLDPRIVFRPRGDHSHKHNGRSPSSRDRLRELLLVLGSRRLNRLVAPLSASASLTTRIGRDRHFLYDAVRRAHGSPIIVDSTKTAGDAKTIWLERTGPMRFILLVRDGRAVCYSRMRRERVPMDQSARIWAHEHRKRRVAQATVPDRAISVVRYEDLCRSPETELRRILAPVGLDFEPSMLDFRRDRHNLGGNPMRKRSGETKIELDERWREELTVRDLETFRAIAGQTNRRLGYDD